MPRGRPELKERQRILQNKLNNRRIVGESYSAMSNDLKLYGGSIPNEHLQYVIANAIFHCDIKKNTDPILKKAAIDEMQMILQHMVNSDEGGKGFIPNRFRVVLFDVISREGKVCVKLGKELVSLPDIERRSEIFYDFVMKDLRASSRYLEENLYRLITQWKPQIPLNNDGDPDISDSIRYISAKELVSSEELSNRIEEDHKRSGVKAKLEAKRQSDWDRLQHRLEQSQEGQESKSSSLSLPNEIDPIDICCQKIVEARNAIFRNNNDFTTAYDFLEEAKDELQKLPENLQIEKGIIECDILFQESLLRKRQYNRANLNITDKIITAKKASYHMQLAYEESEKLVDNIKEYLLDNVEDPKNSDLLLSALLQQSAIIHAQSLIIKDIANIEGSMVDQIDQLEESRLKSKEDMIKKGHKWCGRLKELEKLPSIKTRKLQELKSAYDALLASNIIEDKNPNPILREAESLKVDHRSDVPFADKLLTISGGHMLMLQRREKIKGGIAQFNKMKTPSYDVKNSFVYVTEKQDVKADSPILP